MVWRCQIPTSHDEKYNDLSSDRGDRQAKHLEQNPFAKDGCATQEDESANAPGVMGSEDHFSSSLMRSAVP
jgi:hypothetical protein